MELISCILSLQLAGDSSVIITDRTLIHRFHGLRDVKIINVQLVQGVSESGAVGDRIQPVDRAYGLARVSSPVGENSGGEAPSSSTFAATTGSVRAPLTLMSDTTTSARRATPNR